MNLDPAARVWLAEPTWPSLIYAEVAHVLLRLSRNDILARGRAEEILDAFLAVDADIRPVETVVGRAHGLARERGLSVYDACYVALAETLDLPLVTADRKLAAATPRAILIA